MSKFGETADIILEMLHNGENIDLNEIEEILPLSNAAIIDFMYEFGLIELNKGNVRITKSGLELID